MPRQVWPNCKPRLANLNCTPRVYTVGTPSGYRWRSGMRSLAPVSLIGRVPSLELGTGYESELTDAWAIRSSAIA